jgi:hypothetical protein
MLDREKERLESALHDAKVAAIFLSVVTILLLGIVLYR